MNGPGTMADSQNLPTIIRARSRLTISCSHCLSGAVAERVGLWVDGSPGQGSCWKVQWGYKPASQPPNVGGENSLFFCLLSFFTFAPCKSAREIKGAQLPFWIIRIHFLEELIHVDSFVVSALNSTLWPSNHVTRTFSLDHLHSSSVFLGHEQQVCIRNMQHFDVFFSFP